MKDERDDLLAKARESLEEAKVLFDSSHYGTAAQRAYFAMFYIAEVLLMNKDLLFSKHSGVVSAFGRDLVKAGEVPERFHRYLIHAYEVRQAADYGSFREITRQEAETQITNAREFVELLSEQQEG